MSGADDNGDSSPVVCGSRDCGPRSGGGRGVGGARSNGDISRVVEGARLEIALAVAMACYRFRLPLRSQPLDGDRVSPSIAVNLGRSLGIERVTSQYVTVRGTLNEHALRRVVSGGLRPDDQDHVTVEHLQPRQLLIDGLAVVRLIEQSIELRRRCPQPAHDLALRERARRDSLLALRASTGTTGDRAGPQLPVP